MTDDDPINPALLPAGLRDLLPPDAETEAASVEALMEVFAAHGYARVKPPLLEFADSLLAGAGGAVAEQTFRLMDPDSQRMMGLRADTTPQVARIAATRLATAPRPLRLSYAGQCLLVRGSQLAPDRQIAQAGIELIGPDTPAADAEIVLVGAEALKRSLSGSPMMTSLTSGMPRRDTCAHAPPSTEASVGCATAPTLLTLLALCGSPFSTWVWRMLAVVQPPITGLLPWVRQEAATSSASEVTL